MTTTIPTPQLRPHIPTCLTCRTPKNGKQQALSQNQVQITWAMALLHAGLDTSVIALWLGHEDPGSTQAYLHAA
jgi:site-specific recombinase XerD